MLVVEGRTQADDSCRDEPARLLGGAASVSLIRIYVVARLSTIRLESCIFLFLFEDVLTVATSF